MRKLDKIDLKLLTLLELDSRQTLSYMAKSMNTSQQFISHRMQNLKKYELVGGYYTIINFTQFGYTSYRTMVRLTNIDEKKQSEIISFLMNHPNVLWFVDCTGRWDLIINFLAKNIVHYDKFMRDLKNQYPEQIQNYDVLTTLDVIYFGRDYFLNKYRESKKLPIIKQYTELIKYDSVDLKILDLIAQNARMSSVELSGMLGVSSNTIINRIKNMKLNGLIQGFKPLIHLENTSYESYKALIKFQNITDIKEKKLIRHLKNEINVVGIIKLVGAWDFEIEFEVDSKKVMFDILRTVRDKFKDIIKDFELLNLYHEYKYDFFPGDILNKIE